MFDLSTSFVMVVAKEPLAGKVKTRLCPPCLPSEAAGLAAASLDDTLAAVRACRAGRRILAVDGAPGAWIPDDFEVVFQVGANFNDRLQGVWDTVGGAGVQIGMDTPQLTGANLDDALTQLHSPGVGAVFGPATDGGWWLLGLHKSHDRLFTGIPMSTARTGDRQHRRLLELGLNPSVLDEIRDLDSMADAEAIASAHPHLDVAEVLQRVHANIASRALEAGLSA